eukprot:6586074-Prymnesium_polylepis.2
MRTAMPTHWPAGARATDRRALENERWGTSTLASCAPWRMPSALTRIGSCADVPRASSGEGWRRIVHRPRVGRVDLAARHRALDPESAVHFEGQGGSCVRAVGALGEGGQRQVTLQVEAGKLGCHERRDAAAAAREVVRCERSVSHTSGDGRARAVLTAARWRRDVCASRGGAVGARAAAVLAEWEPER